MSNTAYKMSVMQAFENGEPIEVYDSRSDKWRGCHIPHWDWIDCDYRIAEKPSIVAREYHRRERIVEAFRGGAKIESRWIGSTEGSWGRDPIPLWRWEKYDYRVAPRATACAFLFEGGGAND